MQQEAGTEFKKHEHDINAFLARPRNRDFHRYNFLPLFSGIRAMRQVDSERPGKKRERKASQRHKDSVEVG